MARTQGRLHRSDAWRLVDVQAKAMSCAVKESLHAAVDAAGMEPAGFEQRMDFLVDVFAVNTIADLIETDPLPGLHCGVHFLQTFRCMPADDGATEIAEVTGFLGAGKDVKNDRCVCFDRAG